MIVLHSKFMLGCDGIHIVDGDGSFNMECRYRIQLCSIGCHLCLFKCFVHGGMKQDPFAPLPSFLLVLDLFLVLVLLEEFVVIFCTFWEDGVVVFLICLLDFFFFLGS